MRLRISLLSLLTAVSLTGSVGLASSPAAAATTREARLVALINDARADHGLRPLRVSSGLTRYARQHSAAMWRQGYLFHTSDFTVVCCWSAIAENVAVNFGVKRAHRSLMMSPGHRANILHPSMRAVGVGAVRRDGRLWVTQVFRAPR
jgi:uncharacterized protein YkwD